MDITANILVTSREFYDDKHKVTVKVNVVKWNGFQKRSASLANDFENKTLELQILLSLVT